MPGSFEQYSCVNICHGQISSIIVPSKVSSAAFPGQPEKLAQHIEEDRNGGDLGGAGACLSHGLGGGEGEQLCSLQTPELLESALLMLVCAHQKHILRG